MAAIKFVKGSPTVDDFFKVNLELNHIPEFSRLIEKVGKEQAGKIMWAVYMAEDPSSSIYGLEGSEKRINVARKYLDDEGFDWEPYEGLIGAYKRHCMGPKKRQYAEYMEMMEQRHTYIRTLSYEGTTPSAAKEIDALIKGSKAIWDELAKIEKEYLNESESYGRVRGDKQLSATELNLI